MSNFTVADLVQTTGAASTFVLFLLPSGYLLGQVANVFDFRTRSAAEKLQFSIALSAATTPILGVLLARFLFYRITLAILLLLALISLGDIVRQVRQTQLFARPRQTTWIALGMALAWFVLVLFSLADLQVGHRLYISYVAYDHSVRVPFVNAAARMVPPLNPFFGLGEAPVLRYYYYWYVVCALPVRLFGTSAKASLDASVFWSGLGLASTIPLYLKYFLGEKEHLRRKSLIGIGLLAVTGLDLFPYAIVSHIVHRLPGDMEWWDPNQITSWIGSLLWVPNHVASLTAGVVGLLVLSTIDDSQPTRQRVWAVVISGLAFASAAGLSLYVTLTLAISLFLWSLWVLLQKEIRTFITYVAVGAFAMLFSWPFLLDLVSPGGSGGTERLASIGFRRFTPLFELFEMYGIHNTLLLRLLDLPVLVLVYILEFGFFFVVAVVRFRQDFRSPEAMSRQRKMAWIVFVAGMLTMTFLRSNSTVSNDLGFRGMLIVQFVLLIWAIPIADDVFFVYPSVTKRLDGLWIKPCVVFTLLLGIAGTAYQVVALRCYAPLADAGKLARSEGFLGSHGFGERTYWFREGYRQLDRVTSPAASVQYNPAGDEVYIAHLYSTHQAAVGDPTCGAAFGGDPKRCEKAFPYFDTVFNGPQYVKGWDIDAFCRNFHVDVLVSTDSDPVWQDHESWVWTRPLLYANPLLRAVPCGMEQSLTGRK